MMMMKKVMVMVMMVSWWKSTEWGNLALYPFTAGSFTGTLFFMGGVEALVRTASRQGLMLVFSNRNSSAM